MLKNDCTNISFINDFQPIDVPTNEVNGNQHYKFDSGTLVIGDSFAEMFKLIAGLEVLKFKGGTAKGLTRFDNENRTKLMRTVYNRSFNCCIFTFGQVGISHYEYV